MGELFALLSACSFAGGNVAIRRGMRTAADNGVFMSIFFNLVAFVPLALAIEYGNLFSPKMAQGFVLFAIAGLLTTFGGRSFHYAAIRVIGPSRAVSIRAGSPIFTVALAFLFLREYFSVVQFFGSVAVVGGIWLLSREIHHQTDLAIPRGATMAEDINGGQMAAEGTSQSLVGLLLGTGAAASFGAGHFMRKFALLEFPSPYWGMAIGTVAAWTATLVQAATKRELAFLWRANFDRSNFPRLYALAGVFNTFGQMFNYLAIYHAAVSLVSVLASSEPLVTVGISRLVLGGEERLNWKVILSAAVVCIGVVLLVL